MFNIKYQAQFRNINNELYTIEIKEDGYSGSVTTLVCGVSPFIANYESNSDFLYHPLRFSGGTLKIVGKDYLQSLFSTNYQQYQINLLNASNNVVWTGFITPEIYSQEYNGYTSELEIECISALSTLEYIKFEKTSPTISLFQLIKDSIVKSKGQYNNVYVPVTYGTNTTNIINDMIISQSNFIDEEDEPMTYKEIMEEVCKYLGWTMTERNGDIYFIDIDYIKNKNGEYFKYNSTLTSFFIATLPTTEIDLKSIESKGIDNTLSIIGGYNKVNIIDSDYEVENDSLFPELVFNNDKLNTINETQDDYKYIIEHYGTTQLRLFNYSIINGKYVSYNKPFDNVGNNAAGAVACQQTNYDLNDIPNKLNWEKMISIPQFSLIHDNTKSTYLYDRPETELIKYPIITAANNSGTFLFDPLTKLSINWKTYMLVKSATGVIHREEAKHEGGKDWNNEDIYFPIKIRCGVYYYNGTSWVTNSNTTFKLYTSATNKTWTGQWIDVKDTNSFDLGVNDLNGTIINFDKTIFGDIEIIIYNPHHPLTDALLFAPVTYFLIKDIEINAQRQYFDNNPDKEKKDTIYSNVVNEKYINELDDITLKITSGNDSNISHSKVVMNGNILNTIMNKITNTAEKPEKILIQRIINQYKQPKFVIESLIKPSIMPYQIVFDKYLSKRFISVNEIIDYHYDQTNIKLIEIN